MSNNYYDHIAGIYDASRYLTPHVAIVAAEFMASEAELSSSSLVMEVGIGTATNVLPLAPRGVRIVGTEQSQHMLDQADRRLNSVNANYSLLKSDKLPLPLGDEAADAVLTVHVVHAFADWRGLIEEIVRVLKPGGVYFYGEYLLPPHRQDFESLYRTALAEIRQPPVSKTPRPPMPTMVTVGDELQRLGLVAQKSRIATWTVRETVGQLLSWYEARAFGSCWGMPDDVFLGAITLLKVRLAERFPSLDHELQSDAVYDVLSARKAPSPIA